MANPEETYLDELLRQLPVDVSASLSSSNRQGIASSNATWHTRTNKGALQLADLPTMQCAGSATEVVIVVENIDLRWLKVLGTWLRIPPSFFVAHANDPGKNSNPWSAVLPPSDHPYDNTLRWSGKASYWHINGVITSQTYSNELCYRGNCIPRTQTRSERYGFNASTSVSAWTCQYAGRSTCRYTQLICAVTDHTVVILVDKPVECVVATTRPPPDIILPVSHNRGGLLIPYLYRQKPSLHLILEQFFSHSWHFNALFPTITATTFWYLVISSTWETNLSNMNKLIKHVSFEKIREPTTAINNELHDFRHDLDQLHGRVKLAHDWMPELITHELEAIKTHRKLYVAFPGSTLSDVLEQTNILQGFLMDSFTLLLSSISLQEAATSARQSMRAQQLTALAFVYVPLSFVTGIYGMNVTEINGSQPSAWIPVATLGIVILLTAMIFVVYWVWERHSRRRKLSLSSS